MKTVTRWGSVAGIAFALTTAFAAPAQAAPTNSASAHNHHDTHAVFVQTDGVSGNKVIAYDRSDRGTLTLAGTYATGGNGGSLTGAVVDRTASQGALTYDQRHSLLYAVNPGSNTVTVFAVDGDHLDRLQVIGSGGSFPVSVTVHGDLVYVLNALDGGAIQGFRLDDGHLHAVPQWHRVLGLDPAATPQFTHTPGQVAFTPDGSALLVTTKANTNAILVFGVGRRGELSANPVVNAKPGSVPFGVTFDQRGRVVVAETGTNSVVTYSIDRDGRLTQLASAATAQAATCWITADGNLVFASNAGSASVSGFRSGANALTALGNTSTGAGTVDADFTEDGNYLYVQTGAIGGVDGFRVSPDGSLTPVGSVTVPDAVGGEGIVAL